MAASQTASKRVPPPTRSVSRQQKPRSFLQRHHVAFAVTTVAIAVLLGVWLALSSPSAVNPLVTPSSSHTDDHDVNDVDFMEATRRLSKTWTLSANPNFNNLTVSAVSALLGGAMWSVNMEHAPYCPTPLDTESSPVNFDTRKEKPECDMQPHELQLQCASSWATSAADSISARLCWADPVKYSGLRMSPQTLLSCVPDMGGCQGGPLDGGMVVAMKVGLVSTLCFPYTAAPDVSCNQACPYENRTFIEGFCRVKDQDHLRAEIKYRGPVAVIMVLTDDLLLYTGGVYKPTPLSHRLMTEEYPVTHGAVLLGWGEDEEDDPYWIVQADLGETWGEKGVGKISVHSRIVIDAGAIAPVVAWEKEKGDTEEVVYEEDHQKEDTIEDKGEEDSAEEGAVVAAAAEESL